MKTNERGGATANHKLEDRLARQFGADLEQAERDYSALGRRRADPSGQRPVGLAWPRLAVPIVAIVLLIGGGFVGFGLVARSSDTTTGPGGFAVAFGADGIPSQIDGERVYRVGEVVESEKQGGYLLGGYVFQEVAVRCPGNAPAPSDVTPCASGAEASSLGLGRSAGSDAASGGLLVGYSSPEVLSGWVGAPVVARMKGCTLDNGTPCPPVVMALVWPTVLAEIAGERVYRATDKASFAAIKGSFLLGGRFAKPSVVPPCPAPVGKSEAEQQLIPYCYLPSIDGLQLAPKSSIDEPNDEIVVVRAHVNDALAAQCPAAVQGDCEAAIVVESLVWRSDALFARPTTPADSSVPAASAGGSGPAVQPSTEPAKPPSGSPERSPERSPAAATSPIVPNPSPS